MLGDPGCSGRSLVAISAHRQTHRGDRSLRSRPHPRRRGQGDPRRRRAGRRGADRTRIVDGVVAEAEARFGDAPPTVEHVQDLVEKALVREGLYEVAKAYILYRADRQRERDAAARRGGRAGPSRPAHGADARRRAPCPSTRRGCEARGHGPGRRSRARRVGRRAGRRGAAHDLRRHRDDADRARAGAGGGRLHRARPGLQRRRGAPAARRAVPRGHAAARRGDGERDARYREAFARRAAARRRRAASTTPA